MYLRHTTVRKDGKDHRYWRLVRSVRRNGKVVQETVAQLGELDAEGRANARCLAEKLMGGSTQGDLFEEAEKPGEGVKIVLSGVRVERARRFGDVFLGWSVWQALGLDALLSTLIPQGREGVPWPLMAAILTLGRLCEPSSELHVAESWYRKTALEDLLGVADAQVNDDRLYRALDRLLEHKNQIESHIRARLSELFAVDYDLLLYDVTSTFFEGLCAKNPMAKRGHSRDQRSDCKQVCIALVVTREGLPLSYEVFDGNRVDVTTVEEIVETMETRFGLAQRIWVMDRGMASQDNIAWLQKTGRRYLLGASRSELAKWKEALLEERDWRNVREGLDVKLTTGPDAKETFVLCRSEARRTKESAIHERFRERIEQGLASLERRLLKARSKVDRGPVERQIGRLLGRNSRAAGRFVVDLLDDASLPGTLRLKWSLRADLDEWARYSDGCYILRTNIADWTAEDLWKTYIQLTDAEAAFRICKSDLSIRPIWHQKPERVKAHIFVCFLAYVLWKTLEKWQTQAGLGSSPRTLLEEFGHIQSVDVVLPTVTNPPRELTIRCVVRPDPSQAILLDRLGIHLPQRLRKTPLVAKV
jgi:transposase